MVPCPVPPSGVRHFLQSRSPRGCPERRQKERGASGVFCHREGGPTPDRDETRAPAKERCSTPSESTLWGSQRRGIETAALVPKSVSIGDASGTCPKWDAIATSPENPASRNLAGWERSESNGERGSSRQRVTVSSRLRYLHRLRASPGR